MEHLSSFIADCDRKTELAKRRLKETQEELSEEANGKVSEEGYINVNQIFCVESFGMYSKMWSQPQH